MLSRGPSRSLVGSALLGGAAGIITVSAAPSKALAVDPIIFTNLNPIERDLASGNDYTTWNITNSTGKTWTDFHIDCGDIGCRASPFHRLPYFEFGGITFLSLAIVDGTTFDLLDYLDEKFGANTLTVSANNRVKIYPTAGVPAPLPIAGLGAAFAYSRRIRKRIAYRDA